MCLFPSSSNKTVCKSEFKFRSCIIDAFAEDVFISIY